MSQILDAINKADAERKRSQKTLSQQEALAHIVQGQTTKNNRALQILLVMIFLSFLVILTIAYRVVTVSPAELPAPSAPSINAISAISPTESTKPEHTEVVTQKTNAPKAQIISAPKANVDLPFPDEQHNIAIDLPNREKPSPTYSEKSQSAKEGIAVKASLKQSPSPAIVSTKQQASSNPVSPNVALKINALVFDENPANRFVIVNGVRLVVGDSIPNTQYRLSAIRADGIIVDGNLGAMFVKSL